MIRPDQAGAPALSVPDDPAYLCLVEDLLDHPAVREMARYPQHGSTSCLEHCVHVSYLSYLFCAKHGLNTRAAARAGLLHDLFLYDWHTYRPGKGERLHGFEHPRKALENAQRYFSLCPVERDCILRHMFPLTLTPPKYREGYVLMWIDKYCSLMETFRRPVMARYALQERRLERGMALAEAGRQPLIEPKKRHG